MKDGMDELDKAEQSQSTKESYANLETEHFRNQIRDNDRIEGPAPTKEINLETEKFRESLKFNENTDIVYRPDENNSPDSYTLYAMEQHAQGIPEKRTGLIHISHETFNNKITTRLDDLTIEPNYRGRGIGSDLFAGAEIQARARGSEYIYGDITRVDIPYKDIAAQEKVDKFYTKNGCKVTFFEKALNDPNVTIVGSVRKDLKG
jgi:GNAT superfamily N-acetyltransferase